MSQTAVAALAAIGAVVVALLDGRRAVAIAAVVAGVTLAPAAGSVAGSPGALLSLLTGLGAALVAELGAAAAARLPRLAGLDPLVPVVAAHQGLFGPRSVRAMAAAAALLGASWVALNVPVGGAGTATGAVFAAADLFLVGVLRLLRGRSLDELAVGAETVALAAATGWVLEAGPDALGGALAVAGLAPLVAAVAGWLVGRHHRPAAAVA